MNFLKRAKLYLIRKKGRTILLTLLLFLMSCFVLVGISFKESAEKELGRLRQSMASGFLLKADIENEQYIKHVDYEAGGGANVYDGPLINGEMIEKICAVDGVKDYVSDLFGYGMWADLELKPAMWTDSEAVPGDPYLTEEANLIFSHQISACPCRNGELQKYFRTGALTIVEGRNIEEGDRFKAVVSDWIAKQNHLSPGDTFTVEVREGYYQHSDDELKRWGDSVVLEVVGIFHANFHQESSVYIPESCLIENCVYTDMDTYEKMRENEQAGGYYRVETDECDTVEFLVEDPKDVDAIMQQVENMEGLDMENLYLEVDNTDYVAAARPYSQIRVFAMILLAVGLCGVGIILYLALRFWVLGRGQEIGILYSIGIKKREVLGQMLTECLLAATLAITLAFLLSGPLMRQCADVAERITAPRTDVEAYEIRVTKYFIPEITKTSSDEAVLERTFSVETAGFVILFVCGISGFSVLLSFLKISDLEPKKLLQSL